MDGLSADDELLKRSGKAAGQFVKSLSGATEKVLQGSGLM